MRWLMIVLLVSVVALLAASAGLAYHVWRAHKGQTAQSPSTEKQGDLDIEREEAP